MLTDVTVRNLKAIKKQAKHYDSGGLFLLVTPKGNKWWRLKYRFAGKEKQLSLGTYPQTSLKEARLKRDVKKKLLADGIDPSIQRKESKLNSTKNSLFKGLAEEWLSKRRATWTEGHVRTVVLRLKNYIYPWLGNRPVLEITPPEILSVLRRIESRGLIETAHRVKSIIGQVFRYGISTGQAERDQSADLKGALTPTKPKNMATITDPKAIAELLRAIHGYGGHYITCCALKLAPLLFVRPGELRHAEWAEINLDEAMWRIPAEKMKMKRIHMVPLSNQAIEILKDIQPLTGQGKYIFPSPRSKSRPMSNNAVLSALRRMGYNKEEISGHGFRAMASTRLYEMNWPSHVVEMQLAHAEKNKVKAAYNHAEYLTERTKLMQAWADYLDGLRSGADIVPLHKSQTNG